MKRYLVIVIGLAAAALFVRLGVWQLQRMGERRARNAAIVERLAAPLLDTLPLRAGTVLPDSLRFRRARVSGVFDFTREVVLVGRAYQGMPGVHVVTPLRLSDTVALLVERGWVFSPDGRTVGDREGLIEPDSTVVSGVLLLPSSVPQAAGGAGTWPRYARGLDVERLAASYPYRLVSLVLRRTATDGGLPGPMRALAVPEVSGGPHLSYAIQWFAFAGIALVGSVLLFRSSRGRSSTRRY